MSEPESDWQKIIYLRAEIEHLRDECGAYAMRLEASAAEIERLQDAKRRALKIADERAIEANELRQQLDKQRDIMRNIAGLADDNFYISKHAILVAAVKEWRDEIRALSDDLRK